MSYYPSRENRLLAKAAREYARKELLSNIETADQYPFTQINGDTLEQAFQVDFFHSILPETMDGFGRQITPLCIILNQICRIDAGMGGILFTNAACQDIILNAGSPDLLASIVKSAERADQMLIAGPLFDHPGSTEADLVATGQADRLLLSGSVSSVANGNIAHWGLFPAIDGQSRELTYFLVDLHQDAITVSPPIISLGMHACPLVDITFTAAEARQVGKRGKGLSYFDSMYSRLSVAAAAMANGVAEASLEEACSYAKKREQGGRKIIEWSEVRMLLAEMALKNRISDLATTQACQAVDNRFPEYQSQSVSVAIHAAESACSVTTDGIQILGGYGYMKDYEQEKRFRDAKQVQALLGISPLGKLKLLSA